MVPNIIDTIWTAICIWVNILQKNYRYLLYLARVIEIFSTVVIYPWEKFIFNAWELFFGLESECDVAEIFHEQANLFLLW